VDRLPVEVETHAASLRRDDAKTDSRELVARRDRRASLSASADGRDGDEAIEDADARDD
jgi:hypothetical protein